MRTAQRTDQRSRARENWWPWLAGSSLLQFHPVKRPLSRLAGGVRFGANWTPATNGSSWPLPADTLRRSKGSCARATSHPLDHWHQITLLSADGALLHTPALRLVAQRAEIEADANHAQNDCKDERKPPTIGSARDPSLVRLTTHLAPVISCANAVTAIEKDVRHLHILTRYRYGSYWDETCVAQGPLCCQFSPVRQRRLLAAACRSLGSFKAIVARYPKSPSRPNRTWPTTPAPPG